MSDPLATLRAQKAYPRVLGGLAAGLLGVSALALSMTIAPMAASADVAHNSCQSVSAGGSSGWCGLYPGNATDNVQELGLVTVSSDGTSIVVQTEDASTGIVPATSFACLVATAPSQITHRLQDTLCAQAGGVWFPAPGGSITINLTQYPQFLNTQFTVQVAANQSAQDSNGDSFYNNVATSTVTGTPFISAS